MNFDLLHDLYGTVPVSELRAKYTPQDVATIPLVDLFLSFSPRIPLISNPERCLELFTWLFDECHVSFSAHVMEFEPVEEGDEIFGNVFDYVLFWVSSPLKGELMHFLVKRGAKPILRPGRLLARCQTFYEAHILFDMGAKFEPGFCYQEWIFLVETSRQVARAKIKALIHGAKRLSRWIAPDMARLIGKMIWASRWNDFKPLE